MVFPNPAIPNAPDASSDSGSSESSVLLSSSAVPVKAGKGTAARCRVAAAGDEVVLSVYEAEELVRVSRLFVGSSKHEAQSASLQRMLFNSWWLPSGKGAHSFSSCRDSEMSGR